MCWSLSWHQGYIGDKAEMIPPSQSTHCGGGEAKKKAQVNKERKRLANHVKQTNTGLREALATKPVVLKVESPDQQDQ